MIITFFIMVGYGAMLYWRGKVPQKHRDEKHKMSVALRVTGIILMVLGSLGLGAVMIIFGFA